MIKENAKVIENVVQDFKKLSDVFVYDNDSFLSNWSILYSGCSISCCIIQYIITRGSQRIKSWKF